MNACSYCTTNQQTQKYSKRNPPFKPENHNGSNATDNKRMYALHYTPLSATLLAFHNDSYQKDPFKEQRTDADLPVGYCKKGLCLNSQQGSKGKFQRQEGQPWFLLLHHQIQLCTAQPRVTDIISMHERGTQEYTTVLSKSIAKRCSWVQAALMTAQF